MEDVDAIIVGGGDALRSVARAAHRRRHRIRGCTQLRSHSATHDTVCDYDTREWRSRDLVDRDLDRLAAAVARCVRARDAARDTAREMR